MTIYRRDLGRLLCAGLITILLVGTLGRYIPSGDSFAVFRLEVALLLIPAAGIAYALGARITPLVSLGVAALAVVSVVRFAGTGPEVAAPDLTLYQHNMLFPNDARDAFVAELTRSGADVATIQEVGYSNRNALMAASEAFPHHIFCRYTRGGVALLARDIGERLASGCAEKTELAWMQLGTAAGPVTIVSVHLRWPWPKPQFWQVDLVAQEIAKLPPPVIIGADFNMVPWAAAIARIAETAQGEVSKGLTPTYFIAEPWPGFRIDNVIAPTGASVHITRTEKHGSDHHGLIARIALPEP